MLHASRGGLVIPAVVVTTLERGRAARHATYCRFIQRVRMSVRVVNNAPQPLLQ
jgi:hypothetical protein